MKKMVFFILFLVSAGCSTTYTKPNFTQQGFDADYTDCKVKVRQAGMPDSWFDHNFMDRCMSGRGWAKK